MHPSSPPSLPPSLPPFHMQLTILTAVMEICVWQEEITTIPEEWRCVSTATGEVCVATGGLTLMLSLSVRYWASRINVSYSCSNTQKAAIASPLSTHPHTYMYPYKNAHYHTYMYMYTYKYMYRHTTYIYTNGHSITNTMKKALKCKPSLVAMEFRADTSVQPYKITCKQWVLSQQLVSLAFSSLR